MMDKWFLRDCRGWTMLCFASLILWGCSGRQGDSPSSRGVPLELHWLEFQMESPMEREVFPPVRLRRIIGGPQNSLLLADSGAQRVLWISDEGKLIEAIGRWGSGPGEFRDPNDLAFDSDSSILWVFDQALLRASLFRLEDMSAEYIREVPGPSLGLSNHPRVGLSRQGGYFLADRFGEQRIVEFDSTGSAVGAFGEIWMESGEAVGTTVTRTSGTILISGDGAVFWIWFTKPVLELWSPEGVLIKSCQIQSPEISYIQSQAEKSSRRSQGVRFPVYLTALSLTESGRLFLAIPSLAEFPASFYEYNMQDCSIVRRFQVSTDSANMIIRSFVVREVSASGGLEIFAIDEFNSHQVMILRAEHEDTESSVR